MESKNSVFPIKVFCPKHEHYPITHGCSLLECTEEILFCSSCLLDNLEHVHEHKKHIFPISQFISEFSLNLQNIKENVRPFQQIYSEKASNMSNFIKFVQVSKETILNELQNIQDQFNFLLDKIQVLAFSEIEKIEALLLGQYDNLDNLFQSSEFNNSNYSQETELTQKLQSMSEENVIPFLNSLRHAFQNFKEPGKSNTISYLNKAVNFLRNFTNKKPFSFEISGIAQRNFKSFYCEIEKRIKEIMFELAKPIQELNQGDFSNGFRKERNDFVKEEKLLSYNNNSKNEYNNELSEKINEMKKKMFPFSKDPDFNRNTLKSFPLDQKIAKNISEPEILVTHFEDSSENYNNFAAENNLISTQKKNLQSNYFPEKKYPSENNIFPQIQPVHLSSKELPYFPKSLIVPNNSFFLSHKFNLSIESIFQTNRQESCLALCVISEDLIASASRDGKIELLTIQQDRDRLNLLKIGQFEYKKDCSAVWSLASVVSYEPYLASGLESGKILLWKIGKIIMKNEPAYVLDGSENLEIITCLFDVGNGFHLINGDSNGTITLWEFNSEKQVKNVTVHNGQINSIVKINKKNGFAAGGFDGLVSYWEIKDFGNNQIDIVCTKTITDTSYIYGIVSLLEEPMVVFLANSNRKIKEIDLMSKKITMESDTQITSEPILEMLTIESQNKKFAPLLLCFTKSQIMLVDSNTLKIFQSFDSNLLFKNTIGLTMCSNNKVAFLQKKERNAIYFAIVDQSNKSNRCISILKLNW